MSDPPALAFSRLLRRYLPWPLRGLVPPARGCARRHVALPREACTGRNECPVPVPVALAASAVASK